MKSSKSSIVRILSSMWLIDVPAEYETHEFTFTTSTRGEPSIIISNSKYKYYVLVGKERYDAFSEDKKIREYILKAYKEVAMILRENDFTIDEVLALAIAKAHEMVLLQLQGTIEIEELTDQGG